MDRVFNLFPLDYGLMKEYTLICMQSRNLKEGRSIIDDSRLSTVLRRRVCHCGKQAAYWAVRRLGGKLKGGFKVVLMLLECRFDDVECRRGSPKD